MLHKLDLFLVQASVRRRMEFLAVWEPDEFNQLLAGSWQRERANAIGYNGLANSHKTHTQRPRHLTSDQQAFKRQWHSH